MAYHRPADLDGFVALMAKADMRIKAQLAEDLVVYLGDAENTIICTDLGLLIDGLIPWLNGSHFKIAQRSLEAFTEIIGRLGQDFNAYTPTVLPHVVDRLGDSRDTVREKAQLLLHKLMESRVVSPQNLLDKLTPCFKHKNSKVREEFLQTIVNTLNEYGTQSLSLKNYIQPVVILLGDPTATVRDAAIQTLVEIYKHVGDRLRTDLRKKDVPTTKMMILEQKFDEIRGDGLLLPSALQSSAALSSALGIADELDTAAMPRPTRLVKRTPSANPRKPPTLGLDMSAPPSSGGDFTAGAVSADVFEACFELVPQLNIFGPRDIEDIIKTNLTIIGDKNMDWEKRVDALKKLRALFVQNVHTSPTFAQHLKDLPIPFLEILRELRSQVVREGCITIAYMSKTLGNKLDQFCIYIIQELINLIQNAAKVISSSGTITLRYVIKFTHATKLIPLITQNLLQSKSKDIRSALCDILILVFDEWSTKSLERNSITLRDALKKGISDADSDARKYSRRAFWGFKRHFPELADNLYGTLDIATQRAVEKERDILSGNGTGSMSASLRGSNSSLNSMPSGVIKRRQTSGLRSPASSNPTGAPTMSSALPTPSSSVSIENLASVKLLRTPSLTRTFTRNRSGIPIAYRDAQQQPSLQSQPRATGFRSISAVDTAAAQRARARAQYSSLARLKVASGTASLQGQMAQQARAKKPASNISQQASPEHLRSVRGPRAGVSQSQPTSRSTSPSSRLKDAYATGYGAYRQTTGTVPKKASGIPRSLANSRETSPTRPGTSSAYKRMGGHLASSSPRRPDRPPVNPVRPILAQKILQQSREAENALADVLSPDDADLSADFSRISLNRKSSRDESDESEASSVCSERSFDSYRRGNDSYSWNGSRSRLDSFRQPIEDIETIIQYCASTHWSERKDGLTSLTQYLSDGKVLQTNQLDLVLDLFRKMFMDTHTKVYALFLDTVNELILVHSNELHDWLFILLTRLFNKLGTDLLGSMHGKIWKTLHLVYEYFPAHLQMQCVFRILVDSAQTPNNKTKVATLKFLTQLATTYCTAAKFPILAPADKAIQKIVQYTSDQKSAELRGQSRMCLIALYNCNMAYVTMYLSTLPKTYQDSAQTVLQQSMRRSTSGTNSPSSPLSCASPKPLLSPQQGPFSLQNNNNSKFRTLGPRSRQSSVEATDPMLMNTAEDVYKSLRRTTAEIQNYSFETKLDRDANSKDSGISQMGGGDQLGHTDHYLFATNGLNGHIGSLEKTESCNGSNTQSAATTESNSPANTVRLDTFDTGNGQQQRAGSQPKQQVTFTDSGELVTEKGTMESEIVKAAIGLTQETSVDTITQVLANLSLCLKYGNCELPIKHFKAIMKMLLNLLESQNNAIMISALGTLSRIVRSAPMKACWSNFLELILLKIIDCYKTSKEVAREIDIIVPKIASVLPVDVSINILNPVIATGEFPSNLCAVKILTDLTDRQGHDITDLHLNSIMPNIARLADDNQSMVRKAAVFCMVKFYVVMGEEKVKPKFSLLNASKIRLLNVYIGKAMHNSSKSSSS